MDEKTTTKIIELITDNAQISRQGLADALGISLFGVDWQIRKLKADGILKREGNNRSGKWIFHLYLGFGTERRTGRIPDDHHLLCMREWRHHQGYCGERSSVR